MSKNTCENLTAVIQELQTLQRRVDLASNAFEPEDGLQAKVEALETLRRTIFHSLFEKEAYEYFVRAFGSEEELRKRVSHIVTTGISGSELFEELKKYDFRMLADSSIMLQDPSFEVVRPGRKIATIRLQINDLFLDERNHTYADVIAKAKELGLGFLPHETAAALLLEDGDKAKTFLLQTIMTKPIKGKYNHQKMFELAEDSDGRPCLDYFWTLADTHLYTELNLLFALGRQKEDIKTII
jgi:hypothetical protein